eukprot:g19495.t1
MIGSQCRHSKVLDFKKFVQQRGEAISWFRNLPSRLWKKLNGRYKNKGQHNTPLKTLAIGDGGESFVLCMRDQNWWVQHEVLADELEENDLAGKDISCISLGSDGSYIFQTNDGDMYWNNVPSRVEQLLQSRTQYSLDDGTIYYENVHESLQDTIQNDPKSIRRVFLSAFDSNYYVDFTDGSSEWVASTAFSNNMEADDWMDPHPILYTNHSIKSAFKRGTSIYEVRDQLQDHTLDVNDIPAIRVVKYGGSFYSLDNRRLWAFSQAGVKEIPVILVDAHEGLRKKLQHFDGTLVTVRVL